MSTSSTERTVVKNLDRGLNSDIHKGSPPTHHQLDGSPRSIGSNSSSTSSNSSGSNTSGSGIDKYYPASLEIDSHKEITLRGRGGIGTSPNSSVPIPIPTQMQAAVMAHTEASTPPSLGDINELLTNTSNAQILQNTGRSFLLAPSDDSTNGTYINWLYDLYSPTTTGSSGMNARFSDSMISSQKMEKIRGGNHSNHHIGAGSSLPGIGSVSPDMSVGVMIPKSEDSPTSTGVLSSSAPATTDSNLLTKEIEFCKEPVAVFRAQERYMIILGAPTSIAQRQGEDTLTYLNKGQFYNIYFRANTDMSLPSHAKSIIYLSFLDEADRNIELSHWQYWYELQANPNQKAFDIDRKNCEGLKEKPIDLGYNAASFYWDPRFGARVVLRINCLSTEFSSQKGVKGLPLHVVVDTFEDTENEAEPSHRAYCKVKIFRDKGAERKNKDETKSVERRLQKFIRSYNSVNLDTDIGPSTVFHPPCKETTLTPTSTFGPKPFLFNLKPGDTKANTLSMDTTNPSASFLANIKEREMKRTYTRTLTQAKEDLDQLEVGPRNKTKKVHTRSVTSIYVRKEEEKVYNALSLRELTVDELKLQISNKYDIPVDMIRFIYKKTKKGLIVRFDDELVSRFEDEDDFIIELEFDNQKGHFDLFICY